MNTTLIVAAYIPSDDLFTHLSWATHMVYRRSANHLRECVKCDTSIAVYGAIPGQCISGITVTPLIELPRTGSTGHRQISDFSLPDAAHPEGRLWHPKFLRCEAYIMKIGMGAALGGWFWLTKMVGCITLVAGLRPVGLGVRGRIEGK
jgi:hypothetical protein